MTDKTLTEMVKELIQRPVSDRPSDDEHVMSDLLKFGVGVSITTEDGIIKHIPYEDYFVMPESPETITVHIYKFESGYITSLSTMEGKPVRTEEYVRKDISMIAPSKIEIIGDFIKDHFGTQCNDCEPGCPTCMIWAAFKSEGMKELQRMGQEADRISKKGVVMGETRHHAIIVTTYNEELISEAVGTANYLFGFKPEVQKSKVGAYYSIFVGPDGSREGWEDSNRGDEQRRLFREWLGGYDENDSQFDWVEISYGGDSDFERVTDSNTLYKKETGT